MAKNGDQVQMMYAFEGIQENHELTLAEGDIVTITNADVGEGWWEGQDASGTIGLFPSGYAEVLGNQSDAAYTNAYVGPGSDQPQDQYASVHKQSHENANFQHEENYDGTDDDWEASWGVQGNYAAPETTAQQSVSPTSAERVSPTKQDGDSPKKTVKATGLFGGINLFSSFSTSPAEAFILGESKVDTSGKAKMYVAIAEDGQPMWENSSQQFFSCTVSNPQKASKFSGLKSYITYNITPSHTGKTVARRYKHFDWLLEQLTKKFSVIIAIPPLPDKQLTGRYEDEFIEGRMHQLQGWIARMSLHPVVSQSEVFQHFLVSKDSEKAWKDGKRKAESDPAVGGAFCTTVVPLEQNRMDLATAETTLQHNVTFTKSLDEALKQTITHGADYSRKCAGPLMREYQKMGQCFGAIGSAFAMDTRESSNPLTEAIKHTGRTYEEIGTLYQDQPKHDWNPLLDGLNEYKGIMTCFPNILGNNKSAIDKQREMARLELEGKYTTDDVENAKLRAETLSYAVQAEINHMQYYRVGDFTAYMKTFVQQQVSFYQNIVSKLQETARMYDGLQ